MFKNRQAAKAGRRVNEAKGIPKHTLDATRPASKVQVDLPYEVAAHGQESHLATCNQNWALQTEPSMDKRLDFRFEIPRPPAGPVVELSNEQVEKILLEKLTDSRNDPRTALWELAQFYKLAKQHEKALQSLRELIQRLPDPEDKANCVFTMGQAMEQVGDYAAAVRYYKEAEALEPAHTFGPSGIFRN